MSLLAGRKGHDWNQLSIVSGFLALKTFFPGKFVDCDSWREHPDNHPDYPGTPGNKSEHIHHPHLLGVVESLGPSVITLKVGLLLQHAPATRYRSKAPSSAPTISSKKICRATKLLLPSFAPSYQTGLLLGSKPQEQICCTTSSFVCTEVYWNLLAVKWRVSSWPIKLAYFFSSHAPIGLFHHSAT